jgi:hypothetical protein
MDAAFIIQPENFLHRIPFAIIQSVFCLIQKQDMIAFMKANTSYTLKDSFRDSAAKAHVYVGEKETGEILRSADAICRALPSVSLHRLPELRHGEFSLNHADRYADAIRQIVRGEQSTSD